MPAAPPTKPKQGREQRSARETEGLPPYNVVLLDDNDHSYDYVVDMLKSVFGHSTEKSLKMALEVDHKGRVIVMTTNQEVAEMKREQIQSFGPDPLIQRCKGSMSAAVEPAA